MSYDFPSHLLDQTGAIQDGSFRAASTAVIDEVRNYVIAVGGGSIVMMLGTPKEKRVRLLDLGVDLNEDEASPFACGYLSLDGKPQVRGNDPKLIELVMDLLLA